MGAKQQNERSCFRRYRWAILLLAVVIIAAAVAAPLAIIQPWNKSDSAHEDSGLQTPNTAQTPGPVAPTPTISPSKDDSAKSNDYTPALNEAFDYATGKVKIRGVNLGGWLVLEPFITPSLFHPYIKNGVVDEWTLCKYLGPEAAKALLEKHYSTWVTEATFIRIRQLGLNHVRIPIGYWALAGLNPDEPFVPSLSWTYLLQAVEWARKYGIRVMVELHAAPGSQNGWNHSGRSGPINWVVGAEGAANAQRTISYTQQLATFFASPNYAHVGPILGLLNEPAGQSLGGDKVKAWYTQALNAVRAATGTGKGPWIVLHDAFLGLEAWPEFKGDRIILDTHRYIMFDANLMRMNRTTQLQFTCQNLGSDITTSTKTFGPTMVGEFSVAANDCAKYLNGIGMGHRWEGTFNGEPAVMPNKTCANENIAATYDAAYKTFLSNYFNAQIDAFEQGAGWFYWNFKTESNPLWSYFDGVDGGWIPKDANNRGSGYCLANGYALG